MFSADNPYYFNNNNNNNNNSSTNSVSSKSPKTPESSSKGFSFFRRKSSKSSNQSSNSQQSIVSSPTQCNRSINSATLGFDANVSLGSPRGSFGSLGSYPQVFEFHNGNHTIYRQSGIKDRYRDRLGSYNESSSSANHHTYPNENVDDVFSSKSRTNGCNTLPTNSEGNRRHSISNFTHRQRCASLSDEVPNMIAPKPPAVMPTVKHRPVNKRKDFADGCSMDDILILTAKNSERAFTWASFLRARFDKITKQRGRKPFNFLHLKLDDGHFSTDLVKKCQTTALQILIFCPAVLALPQQHLMLQFKSILNHEKVLAVLLEIDEKKLLDTHKAVLPCYKSWKKCFIYQNDQSAIGNILGVATDILGRALCHRPPCHDFNGSSNKVPSDAFTVVPKKVRIGQNKILALLNEPLTNDDHLRITIEKASEIIEIKSYKQRNPFTVQFSIPESCMEISNMIDVHIEKSGKNLGSRPVKCESRLREMELLLRTLDNPIEFMCTALGMGSTDRSTLDDQLLKCLNKNMPPNFHLLAGPSDKHMFSIRDKQPEEFPTLLHFAAKYGLEQLCMQLLECPGGDSACEVKNFVGKTPSDIAEQEGFQKLANSLKSFSQMHEFSTMYHYFKGISDTSNESKVIIDKKNFDFLYNMKTSSLPKNLDKKFNSNHSKLVKSNSSTKAQLEYMEMSSGSENENKDSKSPYLNYISVESDDKSVDEIDGSLDRLNLNRSNQSELTNELKINEPPYYQSEEINSKANGISSNDSNRSGSADQFSQECSNALENCSVSSQSEYLFQPSNIPVNPIADYLIQPSNRPIEELTSAYKNIDGAESNGVSSSFSESHVKMIFDKKRPQVLCETGHGTLKRSQSDVSANKGNVDDELAEIMTDFKNNVLSIKEVEQLVEKWKNRNDVKQSFVEKQEQIEKLRDEYEKIQERMKERMKRPTPFERVRKLFSRNKSSSKHALDINPISHHHQTNEELDESKLSTRSSQSSGQRPISSLSTQSASSSSSSGRMSTGSACSGASLGDSGTHSDHEERHRPFAATCRVGSPGSLIDGYQIPTVPRPIPNLHSSAEDRERHKFSAGLRSLNATPTSPITSNGAAAEHYIIFPSNIPIYPESNQSSSLNTIVEAKEMPNESAHHHQPHNNHKNNHYHPSHHIAVPTPINIKFMQEKNIIYGKLSKNNSKDIFTSFKPNMNQAQAQPQVQSLAKSAQQRKLENASLLIDVKKEMNEVYQNINSLTEEKENNNAKKMHDASEFENANSNRSFENNSSRYSNTNNEDESMNNNDDESNAHNYINI